MEIKNKKNKNCKRLLKKQNHNEFRKFFKQYSKVC
jgi:hypothetical protein